MFTEVLYHISSLLLEDFQYNLTQFINNQKKTRKSFDTEFNIFHITNITIKALFQNRIFE